MPKAKKTKEFLFTAAQLKTIINKWSKPANMKKIQKNYKIFYEDIGMKPFHKTRTITEFIIKQTEPGIRDWGEKDFIKYTDLLAKMLRNTDVKLKSKTEVFTAYKKIFRKYHSDDPTSENAKRWKSLAFSMSKNPSEVDEDKKKSSNALKSKNENQFIISEADAQKFINAVAFTKDPDIQDQIIACQVCAGLRMVEVLSKNVSNFKKAKDEEGQAMLLQVGVAKQKGAKDANDVLIDKKREVTKPLIMISHEHFLKNIKSIRTYAERHGDIDTISNKQLGKRFNGDVNKRIKWYLDELKIEKHKEVRSSHGMRRLYVNYAFTNRKNRNVSLQLFITKYLGHDERYISSAAANYSSILVETASILTENQASQVNQAQQQATINAEKIAEIEAKCCEKPSLAVCKNLNVDVKCDEPPKSSIVFVSNKQKKWKKIEKLVKEGVITYAGMQNAGISTYSFSQWKKANGLATPARVKPTKTVAEVVAELKKKGKSATFGNLRAAGGFTNAEIKAYKTALPAKK